MKTKTIMLSALCASILIATPVLADIVTQLNEAEAVLGIDNSDQKTADRVIALEEELGLSSDGATLPERIAVIESELGIDTESSADTETAETTQTNVETEAADAIGDLSEAQSLQEICDFIADEGTKLADDQTGKTDELLESIVTFSDYQDNQENIKQHYSEIEQQAENYYNLLIKAYGSYYHMMEASIDLSDYNEWDDALSDFYDSWDDCFEDYYDVWDDIFEDIYSKLDDVISEGYDTANYADASAAWTSMYEDNIAAWTSMYEDYSAYWTKMYTIHTDVWSGLYSGSVDFDNIIGAALAEDNGSEIETDAKDEEQDSDIEPETSAEDSETTTDTQTEAAEETNEEETQVASNANVEITDAETIKQVQELLNTNGYDCGTPDGVPGAKTYAAVAEYKASQGLDNIDKIDQQLLDSLLAISENGSSSSDSTTEQNNSKNTQTLLSAEEQFEEGKNELFEGSYIVGEDIAAGTYDLIYTAAVSEDDYWSNDYLYIINSGSTGSNSTWGGTRFDDRYGSFSYDAAANGTVVHVKLNKGDQITVEGGFGIWTCEDLEKTYDVTDTGALPEGNYTIGTDIPAGAYDLTYIAAISEDDYWSNDYLYIINSGSEGESETLGGTKYDYRFGSWDYQVVANGKTIHLNLKDGDVITPNGSFGNWYFTGPEVNYTSVTGGSLYAGTYTVGEDLQAGIYDLTYTPSGSESSYWSNDYLYITNSGSEGESKTLGGTKYDYRFGGWNYEIVSNGKQVHLVLNEGDKLNVEGDYGTWSY